MNKIVLCGRFTKDPTFTQTNSGIDFSRFSIACKSKLRDESGNQSTTFFMCVAWRTLAENIMKFCKKGDLVQISGSMGDRWYEKQDGSKEHVWEVTVDDIEFLTTKEEREKNGVPTTSKGQPQKFEEVDDDNLPF